VSKSALDDTQEETQEDVQTKERLALKGEVVTRSSFLACIADDVEECRDK